MFAGHQGARLVRGTVGTVAIVGPSHAWKTVLVGALTRDHQRYGFAQAPESLDLDDALGSSSRSDARKAIELVHARAANAYLLLVDVGAGQIVEPLFREFLQAEPGVSTVVVWCDERTFRSRHSVETADREFRNNYRPELAAVWESYRGRGQLVDTSAPRTVEECAIALAAIVRRVAGA